MHDQPTIIEDARTLLRKMECVNDIFCYNMTLQLGVKFEKWLEKHKALLKKLKNLVSKEEKKHKSGGKNARRKRQFNDLAS
jgi:hypothetical protein